MNEIVKAKDATIGLSADEMNFFKTIFSPRLDGSSIESGINEIIRLMTEKNEYLASIDNKLIDIYSEQNQMKTAINELQASSVGAIDTAKDHLRKVIFSATDRHIEKTIGHTNPIFTTTLTGTKRNEWIYNNISSLKKSFPSTEPAIIVESIYSEMKKRNGYDVYELLNEYQKTKTESVDVVDMLLDSDTLRLCYELCSNILAVRNRASIKSAGMKKQVGYKEAHSCPSEIRGIVASLSKSGKPSGPNYSKAKKILKSYEGYNIKKMIRETKKKYKIKSCSEWFAVSQYPEVVDYLRNEVSEMMEE